MKFKIVLFQMIIYQLFAKGQNNVNEETSKSLKKEKYSSNYYDHYVELSKEKINITDFSDHFIKSHNISKSANNKTSLAIVFDSTGSMSDDLEEVIKGATLITNTMKSQEYSPIENYILVPFRDPKFGPVTVTTNDTVFLEALNDIRIYGGFDCPEYSVSAIKAALEASLPNSYVYVFSDASAKDHHLVNDVLQLIQRKKSQVVFVLTGDCKDRNQSTYQVYEQIAKASSGQVFHLNKSEVYQVLKYVEDTLDLNRVNLGSVVNENGSIHGHDISVDSTLEKVTISISGGNTKLEIKNPQGEIIDGPPKLDRLLDLSELQIVNIVNPEPGKWTFNIFNDKSHSVKLTGVSKIKFDYGFFINETNKISETSNRPLKEALSQLLIEIKDSNKQIDTVKSVDIIDASGKHLFQIPLLKINNSNSNQMYKTEAFIPPNEFFNIAINGIDAQGNLFRRIGSTAIQPQAAEKPFVSAIDEIHAYLHQSITLICKIESLVPIAVLWFRNNSLVQDKQLFPQSAESEYYIADINGSSKGVYTCKASNAAGVSSKDINIIIEDNPPVIEFRPHSSVALSRTEISLECIVQSDLPTQSVRIYAHYQSEPLKLLKPLNINKVNDTATSYKYVSNDIDESGVYICEAINEEGMTKVNFTINIIPPVEVEITDSIIEFENNQNITILCLIRGSKIGKWSIPDNSTFKNKYKTNNNGIINNEFILNIINTTYKDEGIYTCSGFYNELFGFSPEKASAFVEHKNILVHIGEQVILHCKAYGIPKPDVTWIKKFKADLNESENIYSNDNADLVITNVTLKDEGNYTCKVQNEHSSSEDRVELKVWKKLNFIEKLEDMIGTIGESYQINCHADGIPFPKVKWYHNDKFIHSPNVSQNGQILYFDELKWEHRGKFTCVVANNLQNIQDDAFLEITGDLPKIFLSPLNGSFSLGKTISIECNVESKLPIDNIRVYYQLNDSSKENININNMTIGSEIKFYTDPFTLSDKTKGIYLCEAANNAGQTTESVSIDILPPLKLNITPEYVEFQENEEIAFTCNIQNSIFGFWTVPNMKSVENNISQIEENDNAGGKLLKLKLFNSSQLNEGDYVCSGYRGEGDELEIISSTVKATFVNKPIFISHPSNLTTEIGLTAVLKCETYSIPAASVYWTFPNGTTIENKDNRKRIYINSDSQLIFQNVVQFDQGEYKCKAENRFGSVEGEVFLDTWMKPYLEKTLENITVPIYENINVTCDFEGIPKPKVLWLHNDTEISNDKIINETLIINQAEISNNGKYTCIGKNIHGLFLNEFYIKIVGLEPPLITKEETHIIVRQGDTVEIICRLLEGKPKPTFIWQKNILSLTSSIINTEETPKYKATYDQNYSQNILSIENVLQTDDGNYTCVASNELGEDNFTTYLEVQYPPYFFNNTMSNESLIEVMSGNIVNLQCDIFGNPLPEVFWLKDGKIIDFNKNEKKNEFIITKVVTSDSGNYTCSGQNILGNVTKHFSLDVLEPPIISNLVNTTIVVIEGQLVKLPCPVVGNPMPKVIWSNNKIDINESIDIQVDVDNNLRFIANRSHSSIFKCDAINRIGKDSIVYFVTVYQAPIINPGKFETIKFSLGSIALIKCNADGFPPPNITWHWKGSELKNSKEILINNDGISILNITKEKAGTYICIAQNDAGIKEKEYNIIVQEPPKLLSNDLPTNILVQKGEEKFSIPCIAEGNPLPQLFWIYNGQLLENDDLIPNIEIESNGTLNLKYINEDLDGIYMCQAKNSEGSAHKNYNVSVLVPPTLEKQFDEKKIFLEGFNATLNCPLKMSKIIPTINWYKQKDSHLNLIKGNENNLNLQLLNLSRNDATTYMCNASNVMGNVSAKFQLFINWPPTFLDEQETHMDILQGNPLYLNCTVDANPNANYRWLKDLKPLNEITNLIKRTNSKIHHAGEYLCIASNSIGKAIKKFFVQISTPPQILGEPISKVEVILDDPLTLECIVDGIPKPSIQWNIIHPPDWIEFENGNFLKANNISINSEGLYTCEAKNHRGVVKKNYHVEVLQMPQINEIKLSSEENMIENLSDAVYHLKEHSYNSFFCHSFGKPIPDVVWLKNGKISNESSKLFFQNISIEDSGKYTCMASNKVGTDEFDIIINVLVAPKIHSHSMYRLKEGNSVLTPIEYQFISLNCYATGNPNPDIYWFKDESFLEFYDPNIIKENFGQVLLIRKTRRNHSGNYMCVAKNSVGEDKTTFKVDVLFPPSFDDNHLINQLIISEEGESIEFKCPITGNPKPNIKWLKNPYSKITDDRYSIRNNNSSLYINNITLVDQGIYSCILTNQVGMAEIKFSLEVIGLPKIDPELDGLYNTLNKSDMVVKIRRSFHLYCNALSNKELEILWFKGDKLIQNGTDENEIFISSDGQILSIMDSQLRDTGKYVCVAKNKAGQAENIFNVRIVVPAQWSSWSSWTFCNASCGLGYKKRTRICQYFGDMNFTDLEDSNMMYKGNFNFDTNKLWLPDNALDKSGCEGNLTETIECYNIPCKIDGGWSAWSNWSTCSVRCGLGIQKRHRNCNNPTPKYGGKQCQDSNIDEKICEGIDCSLWLPWSQWSSCSVTCGKGVMKRFRKCYGPDDTCFGNFTETAECVFNDCIENVWSPWSSCSVTCGIGQRKRIRQCDTLYLQHSPQNCKGSVIQIERCRNPFACNENNIDNYTGKKNQPIEKDNSNGINLIPQSIDENYGKNNHLKSESDLSVFNQLPHSQFTMFKEKKMISPEITSEYSIDDSYEELCQDGFYYNTEYNACYDINECEMENNKCHSTQMCKNTLGSFQCLCEKGYISLGHGKRCLDINECSQNVHYCSHECYNLPGSYICKCPLTHIMSNDHKTCIDAKIIDKKDPGARIMIGS